MSNCTIIVEQKLGDTIKQSMFSFDDYRVATAISNLLCNINDVTINTTSYKETPHEH